MAAIVWTAADGVTRTLLSDAPAMAGRLPAADVTPAPGPMEGPLAWPMSGGDAVGFAFRARDQYASFTVIELAADALTQELGVLAAGHLSDGGTARFLTHDRAGRSYVIDVGRQGSAAFGRMAVGEPRFQLAVTARTREPRNLLASIAGLSLTLTTPVGAGAAAGWTAPAPVGATAAFSVSSAGQRIQVTASTAAAHALVARRVTGLAPGDVLTFAADLAVAALAAGGIAYIGVNFLDVAAAGISAVSATASASGRPAVTGTAPAGTTQADVVLSLYTGAPGGTGDITWTTAQLERAGAASAFSASADVAPFVVVY